MNFALENDMLDVYTIQKQYEMYERKKYLEKHESKIWKSTDGKWYTYIPDFKKNNGKRLIKRSTKEELEDYLVGIYKDLITEPTVEMVFEEWIAKKINYMEITNQTVDRYRVDFNKYFDDSMKSRKVRFIDEDCLEEFILNSIKLHNLKSKAWSNLRTIIKGMFLFAKKKGYTNFSVLMFLSELELSKRMFSHDIKPEEQQIYSEKEILQIVNKISSSRSLTDLAILFAIYTGMRVGEIVALKWEDIKDDCVYVNRTQIRYKDENGKVVHEIRDFPKTEAGIRHVVIVSELQQIIKRLRTVNPFTEYVFETKGRCIPKHSVCTRLYYLCDILSFQRKGMHAIRKYYATKLINAGVEEIIIINQMGHTDFQTTKDYYYKNNNDKKYIYEKISSAISV